MWDSTALRLVSVQVVKGRPTVAPHISQTTRDMGHPGFVVGQSQDALQSIFWLRGLSNLFQVTKVVLPRDDDGTMDRSNSTCRLPSSAVRALPDASTEARAPERFETCGKEATFENAVQSSLGIEASRPLASTMQMMAEAFTALHPTHSIAIFARLAEEFCLQAESGLPKRATRNLQTVPDRQGADPDPIIDPRIDPSIDSSIHPGMRLAIAGVGGGLNCPALFEILASGVQLCIASPLISAAGEVIGAVTVFDDHGGLVDGAIMETLQGVCDLARVAIAHRNFYDEVVHRSQYDRLTGLPNRLLLEEWLQQALATARRQGKLVGVCCMDLDHFKQINATLGHELGDAFLKAVSERLNLSIRKIDILSRHAGDEFLLALCDLAEPSDADKICDRLLTDLRVPLVVHGHSLGISASIGISIFPQHGESVDLLLRNADIALRSAKQGGRGRVQMYSPALGRQSRRATEMVDALAGALDLGQLRIAYQPIYTMNQKIVAFESLLRWKHPQWGQISPREFIPIAESSGLIVPIGDWVINEVCRQATEWDAAALPRFKIFANVSGVQLGHPDFTAKIADALEHSGLSPDRLELEITESWIIADLKGAARKLQRLRDLGIGIAIDDFGIGYSTFNYLQELPLDTLKIDRSFVHRLDTSATQLSTVSAITAMAHQLGLKTVAEGVEIERHIAELGEIGCDLMQGFFLSRPLKPHAAASLLRKQQMTTEFMSVATEDSFTTISPAA
jgi:diguanylate cyclase (GGDEF)-like protein